MTLSATTEKKKYSNDYYRFHRICRLEECEIEIHTNRKDHYFCETAHRQEYWKRRRARGSIGAQELQRQSKRIEELEETVKQLKASKPEK